VSFISDYLTVQRTVLVQVRDRRPVLELESFRVEGMNPPSVHRFASDVADMIADRMRKPPKRDG
jgi:hypothetical protein